MDTGLEKILKKIEEDCDAEIKRIIDAAEREANEFYYDAEKEALSQKEKRFEKAKSDSKARISIAVKTFELEKRNMLLKAKNQLIDEAIDMAVERARNLKDEDFLSLVKNLILKHSLKGEGVLRFSEKDSPRITDFFLNEVNSILKNAGKHVEKGESIDIKDGFVIEYRDVNINCTYGALLKGMEDEIREHVHRVLFQEDIE